MYKIYLKSNTTNENANIRIVSAVALTPDFGVALNKRFASQGSVICAWVFK